MWQGADTSAAPMTRAPRSRTPVDAKHVCTTATTRSSACQVRRHLQRDRPARSSDPPGARCMCLEGEWARWRRGFSSTDAPAQARLQAPQEERAVLHALVRATRWRSPELPAFEDPRPVHPIRVAPCGDDPRCKAACTPQPPRGSNAPLLTRQRRSALPVPINVQISTDRRPHSAPDLLSAPCRPSVTSRDLRRGLTPVPAAARVLNSIRSRARPPRTTNTPV